MPSISSSTSAHPCSSRIIPIVSGLCLSIRLIYLLVSLSPIVFPSRKYSVLNSSCCFHSVYIFKRQIHTKMIPPFEDTFIFYPATIHIPPAFLEVIFQFFHQLFRHQATITEVIEGRSHSHLYKEQYILPPVPRIPAHHI